MNSSKIIVLMFVLIVGFDTMQAMNENDVKVIAKATTLIAADVASYGVYSVQIGISQIRGDRDREKRLQFCLWETQNLIAAVKKAKTEEEMDAIGMEFADQLRICQKLVTTL